MHFFSDVVGHASAVIQIGIQVAGNRRVDIEAGDIEQLHRPDHRKLQAQAPLEALVELLGGDDAFLDQRHRLAQNRVEQAVVDETGNLLVDEHGDQPAIGDEAPGALDHARIGMLAGYYFDHRDDVRRIRPVHADNARFARYRLLQARDRDARGIAGEDRRRPSEPIELGEDALLELQALGHRFDDEIRLTHRTREI